MTSAAKQKILKKIKAAIKKMEAEGKKFGFINDGRGTRYVVGEWYLQMEDYAGILDYYKWFYKNFPDDIGFPKLQIAWIIGAIKEKNKKIRNKHLIELETMNTYLLPMLLDQPYAKVEKWEGMNISTEEYAKEMKTDYQSYFDPETIAILKDLTGMERYAQFKERYIEFEVVLGDLPRGVERMKAIEDRKKLEEVWLAWLGE